MEKKQQIKAKINYIYQMKNMENNNDQVVKDIIKNVENKDKEIKLDNVINQEILHQEDDFKSKLEAKRKKIRLNNSDIMNSAKIDNYNVLF
jgi:hypothetical protein